MTSYSTYDDGTLVRLLKSGEEGAFTELYERHWEQMSVYVLKVIHSEEDAHDIVQEVFVSIWKRRMELDIKGSMIAYLLKSTRNLSLRYIEQNITRQNFLDKLSEHLHHADILPTPALLELQELEAKVNKAIEALPPKMREVFILSRMENQSYRDIALALGIAETTVKKQVSNALKAIKTDVGGLSATAVCYLIMLMD